MPLPALAPVQRWAPELLLRAQQVRVAFFDVDGVLTDGGLYFTEYAPADPRMGGETIKRFNTLDGHGLRLLQRAGIEPAIVTGRDSRPLRARLAALGIAHAHFGTEDKLPAAEATLAALGLGWHQASAMGDDWPDLPLLRRAAFACAPSGAHAEVAAVAHHVSIAAAGHGAVRECCDLLLAATGRYDALLQDYSR
ncbi:KdsC family phosphatase [Xylophilus sp. ASV27]|uniref:KdsC family phosphatase n=1 Tax=Xylophilus sp. ASV27 TaxID=2795129 RepID=UPI001E60E0D2|nr:3-deoxy-D-manno-octulosonate 8-phosphate phosphatase [Xylophilus sp. ASV27]